MTVVDDWEIYIRDEDYNIVERLDIWSSFTFIKRFNGIGSYELEVPTSSSLAQHITPKSGVVVRRNGVTVFSGSASIEYEKTVKYIRVGGEDDNALLRSTARPTPSLNDAPYSHEYDVTTGQASAVMRSLVDRNIGPSAPAVWRIIGLVLGDDPVLGSTITARARFDPLITLLRELASTAIAGGLGFYILQDDDLPNNIAFRIYQPQDADEEIIFSYEAQTIKDFSHKIFPPATNWFQVAGGDDFGINRTIVEGGDADAVAYIGRRIPEFVDARGITDLSELEQKLAEKIAGAVLVDQITVQAIELSDYRFGIDYDLGWIVRAIVDGVSYDRIITEVEVEFGRNRQPEIRPVVADPLGSNDDTLAQHYSVLDHRLSNIERNFNTPDNSIIADMLHDTMRWEVGDLKATARSSAQSGWLICDGSAISRTTYSQLFSFIGTVYGNGNGTTTFNIPDARDRFFMSAGSIHPRGETGGSESITIGTHAHSHAHGHDHTHTHSHSHGLSDHFHVSQAHTHPGTHDHGLDAHNHALNHTHEYDIPAHDHGSITGGPSSDTNISTGGLEAATDFHWHSIASQAAVNNADTGEASNSHSGSGEKTSGGTFLSTQGNASYAPSASYTGSPGSPQPDSSENDNTANSSDIDNTVDASLGGGSTHTTVPRFFVGHWTIYTGVQV